MKAYCFVPEDRIEEIRECGMELSMGQHYACKVTTNDGMCFMGRLNPRDYDKGQGVPGKILIKINLDKVRGFIGEGAYLKLEAPEDVKFRMFEDSLLPSGEYRLAKYREPLCLIANTVLPEAVETYDSLMDEAIPYENSRELYIDCLFGDAEDSVENFREIALAAWLDKLAEAGKAEKTSYEGHYVYKTDDTSYILRKG